MSNNACRMPGECQFWPRPQQYTGRQRGKQRNMTRGRDKGLDLLMDQLYRLYGLPSSIVSDPDRKFNSHFWRAVFAKLDTKLNLSTTDHPESNGHTERVN